MGLMYIFIAIKSERLLKIYNAITPLRRRWPALRILPALWHAKCLYRKDEKQDALANIKHLSLIDSSRKSCDIIPASIRILLESIRESFTK